LQKPIKISKNRGKRGIFKMKARVAYYKCEICGTLVGLIKNGGGQLVCCGKPMTEMKANTTEASTEKHIPVATKENGKITVQVGSNLIP